MSKGRHARIVRERMAQSPKYRRVFRETQRQIDLAVLVREMRESARLTQSQLAERADTTQSVIARLEDAEYTGHSLSILRRIAAACNVDLKLCATGPGFALDVPLEVTG
jgi:ribosome-binding protein aMBF1 (putative translation factor)